MSAAEAHIADTLTRAQLCWNSALDDHTPRQTRQEDLIFFGGHMITAVLLEHLRRLDPALAEQLVPWLAGADGGIFGDGYAGELLHRWRQQLAAGQPMDPIAPQPGEVLA